MACDYSIGGGGPLRNETFSMCRRMSAEEKARQEGELFEATHFFNAKKMMRETKGLQAATNERISNITLPCQ
jgi:hypothetical protein